MILSDQLGNWGSVTSVSKPSYLYSEVFDLKPTSGLYLKNSAHLSNFLTPRTVRPGFLAIVLKIVLVLVLELVLDF
jgi:hypothetical protein